LCIKLTDRHARARRLGGCSLLDESLNGVARANEICEGIRAVEEERAQADNDAAFELACRIIVMKSLPAWIDEVCTEQL
jgi:hypothetical protein